MGMLINPHRFAAGATVIFYAGRDEVGTTSPHTFSAAPIGAADATRQVLALIQYGTTIAVSVTGVTIGGVAARKITGVSYDHTTDGIIEAWIATVPTGTTADVVLTFSAAKSYSSIQVFYVKNCGGHEYSWLTAGSAASSSIAFDNMPVKNNGGLAFHVGVEVAGKTFSESWSGAEAVTEDYDGTIDSAHSMAGGRIQTLADSLTQDLTVTISASGDNAGVAVSFGPTPGEWGIASLLCGFNGTDGATAFSEESRFATAATFNGNAQLDTAQKKFGSASLLLDGTGDYITFPNDGRYRFSSAGGRVPFTVEGFFRWNADPAAFQHMIGLWNVASNQKSWDLRRDQVGGQLEWAMSTDGSATLTDIAATWAPTLNQWYHIAVDFDGAKYRLYVDGVMVGSSTTVRALHESTALLVIGSRSEGGSEYFNGWVDEVRIVKGVAVYASDAGFTPPAAEFARS